jgi:salicylate hydroxylase
MSDMIQGAGQCIEDSASLAICLEKVESLSDLPKVLEAFEAIRKPRTEWFVERARALAQMCHLPDGPQQEERD